MAKCPKCQNTVGSGVRGAGGVDENNDPIPFWSDDPILTPLGLAGDSYRGHTAIKVTHIRELQNYYGALEALLELPTITTWLEPTYSTQLSHAHLNQIRIVIESILSASGQTIEDYFQHDRLGNVVVTSQTEWTDVTRTEVEGYPLIPDELAIKAIHIEELRRGVLAGITNAIIMQFYNVFIPANPYNQNVYANYSTGPNPFFINVDISNGSNLTNMRYVEVHKFQHDKIAIFEGPFSSWLSNNDLTLTETWSAYMTQNTNFMPIGYYYEDGGVWYYDFTHDDYWISTEPISSDSDEEEHDYVFYGASRDHGENYVDKFTCPWKKNIGTSNGSTSQVFSTSRVYPTLLPEVDYSITFNNTEMYIYVDGELWERVASLSGQDWDAKVCTITASVVARTGTATVNFGNGTGGSGNGLIPPNGVSIVIEFAIGVSILWEHEAKVLNTRTNSRYTKMTSVDGVRNSLFVNLNDPYYLSIVALSDLDIYHDRIEITLKDEVKTGSFTDPNIYAREYGSANEFDGVWGNKTITNSYSFRKQYWFDIYHPLFGESHRSTPTGTINPVIEEFNCYKVVGTPTVEHCNIKVLQVPYTINGSGASITVTFPYTNYFGITQADWLANYSYNSRNLYWVYYYKGLGGGHAGGMTLAFSTNYGGTPRAIHMYGDWLPGTTETITASAGHTITYHGLDQMISINTPLQAGESWNLSSTQHSSSSSNALPLSFTWQRQNMWWNDKLYKYNSVDSLTLLSAFSDQSQGDRGLFTAFKSGDNGFKLYVINATMTTYDGHIKASGDDYTYLYVSEDGITWTSPLVNKGRAYSSGPVDIGAYVPTLLISKTLTVTAV